MVKPTNSQQVESEKTNRISQQVESDATPPSPDSSVSFEITPEMTQGDDHIADEDADNDRIKDRLCVMFMILLQFKEPEEIHVSPIGSLQI